jgi:hypothetical protein
MYSTKIIVIFIFTFASFCAQAQSRRATELRSCFTSEMALATSENVMPDKGWDANHEMGKKIGYVIAEYYQKAIWAMDDPETEGREVVMYAAQHFEERIKYMKPEALRREVKRCRLSFN